MTTTSGTIPGRVLVVEDEPAISDIVTTALRYQGHDVTQRDHGGDGLDEALAAAHDLIVLDVMLPGLDGFEICRQLRDAGQTTPVLFLSARGDADDRVQGFVTGGDDYLPTSTGDLVHRPCGCQARLQHERGGTPYRQR